MNKEDDDYVDHSLRIDEIEDRRKDIKSKIWCEFIHGGFEVVKVLLCMLAAFTYLKLIYEAEQDTLMPRDKTTLAQKFLPFPRL